MPASRSSTSAHILNPLGTAARPTLAIDEAVVQSSGELAAAQATLAKDDKTASGVSACAAPIHPTKGGICANVT
jgi:hypothetical protein